MNKISRQLRQGDVLLHPVECIPEDAVRQKHQKRLVLAEGEVTGHAHAIRAQAKQLRHFTNGSEVYLEVNFPVTLEHEEHGPLTLEPGCYQVRRQVEEWMDEVRQVAD